MTTRIVLSHADSVSFEEAEADRRVADAVFNRATQNYHNALLSVEKTQKALWEHIAEAYKLDLTTGPFQASHDIKERRWVITDLND